MEYFPLLYRLRAEERYLIWISDDRDSLVVDAEGFILSFSDLVSLRQYADTNGYSLKNEEPRLHDLDRIVAWKTAPNVTVNCDETLTAWNLFIDVAEAVPVKGAAFKLLRPSFDSIYEKLFWGNNLPAVTPPGERFIPEWSPDEVSSLMKILNEGLDLFTSSIRRWPEGQQESW